MLAISTVNYIQYKEFLGILFAFGWDGAAHAVWRESP